MPATTPNTVDTATVIATEPSVTKKSFCVSGSASACPRASTITLGDLPPELRAGHDGDHGEGGYRHARDAWEKRYFQDLLTEAGGSVARAAELAGLHRSTLYEKLARIGLVQGEGEPGKKAAAPGK